MEILYKDRDWLWEHYIVREESSVVMAKEAECGLQTILNWLRRYGIPVRSPAEGHFFATRNSVIIIPDFFRFLRGEILGDGHVGMTSKYSACYRHGSKYEEYVVWLSEIYDAWGIEQAGRITDYKDEETGAMEYHYATRSYPELVPFVKEWYSERDGKMKKTTVPKDLKLTPIMARQWYLGDGHLAHPKDSRPSISLATCDFDIASVSYLVKELCKQGFKATRRPSSNTIGLSTYSVPDFLKWIGPCPISCYDYKWAYGK